jgi:hypothetical protein
VVVVVEVKRVPKQKVLQAVLVAVMQETILLLAVLETRHLQTPLKVVMAVLALEVAEVAVVVLRQMVLLVEHLTEEMAVMELRLPYLVHLLLLQEEVAVEQVLFQHQVQAVQGVVVMEEAHLLQLLEPPILAVVGVGVITVL